MRVKRQRRKLRGKYSGNCLSCNAKWSKCWYIASVENQREWENRLNKEVTPGDDEVCFQCWDAKIRTSPKRKIHYKVDAIDSEAILPNKRRRRSPNYGLDEVAATDNSNSLSPRNRSPPKVIEDFHEEGLYDDEEDDEEYIESESETTTTTTTVIFDESVIFDEAVILLSTAFHTIPEHINIQISSYDVSVDDDDDGSKKRGAYYCGKCGKLKKGHVCNIPSPTLETETPPSSSTPSPSTSPIQSINFQFSPVFSHHHSPIQPSPQTLVRPIIS